MHAAPRACCFAIPFYQSSDRKKLRQPNAAPANGYGRRLAAAAARWQQSGEVLRVSQIAVDPVGLHIILLRLRPILSRYDPDRKGCRCQRVIGTITQIPSCSLHMPKHRSSLHASSNSFQTKEGSQTRQKRGDETSQQGRLEKACNSRGV